MCLSMGVNGMSGQSAGEQLEALMKRRIELANFNVEVNENIADGNIDSVLAAKNADGEYPVVTALGCEPLSLLVERIRALGGVANVFVKGKRGVSFIIATKPTGKGNPVDLSDIDDWGSGSADIDMFLDYLHMQKDGVIIPNRLPGGDELSLNISAATVKMRETPVLA